MSRVRVGGAVRAHEAFGVWQLEGDIPVTSTRDGVPGNNKKMSGGAQMRNQGDDVHPRVMRVGRALCLIELFNDFLRRPADNHVAESSTPRGVRVCRRLAGSRAGLRARTQSGHVAHAAAASRLLPKRFFTIEIDTSGKKSWGTYQASVVGVVDASDSLAVIATASSIGWCGGPADACSVSARGIARGRADVSAPATSRGNDLAQRHQDAVTDKKSSSSRGCGKEEEKKKAHLPFRGRAKV